MQLKYLLLCFYFIQLGISDISDIKKVVYISTEKPVIMYFDKKFINSASANSHRLTRSDPRYYLNLYVDLREPWDNNVKVDFYFYEFIQTNRYRRSFLEMHWRLCDMIEKDIIFGPALRRNLRVQNKSCPFPAGPYEFVNMTIPYLPQVIPFTRGRIYNNVSMETKAMTTTILQGYIEMEVKTMKIKQ